MNLNFFGKTVLLAISC